MAMLVQYLSAKTGVATGRDLPELCREHPSRPVSAGLWVQAELVAMATDLAEFVGAAVGLNLLFNVPLFPSGLLTAIVAFSILALEQRGYRRFELAITGLLGIVFLGFSYDLVMVGADPAGIATGLVAAVPASRTDDAPRARGAGVGGSPPPTAWWCPRSSCPWGVRRCAHRRRAGA
jgi:manganese transport protein